MAKQAKLELDGIIEEVLPAWKFRVRLIDMDTVIMCYKSGKMKMSHISVIECDKVKVEVSPYDVSQWRIVYRYNLNKSTGQYQAPPGFDKWNDAQPWAANAGSEAASAIGWSAT